MKIRTSFFGLLCCCFFFQVKSQSQTNLQLDVEYSLPPVRDSIAMQKTFFTARFSSDFSWQDYNQLEVISAKRVFAQLNSGHKVYNYSAPEIGHTFSGSMELSSAANLKPSDFALPADKIIPDNQFHPVFSLTKDGSATDYWRLSILPDYRFQTGIDTTLVLSKNGKKFIPTTVSQFLDPKTSSLLFVETWNFNPANGQFRKNIHQVGYMEMLQRGGENIGYHWVACLDNADTVGIQKQDVLFKKNVITDVAMSYTETRMNYDSLTKNYSALDALREMNSQTGNIPDAQRTQFFAALMSYAFAHPENVFPVSSDMKIDSLHAFGKMENIKKLFVAWDSTVQVEDPNKLGTFFLAPVKTEITFDNIYGLRFYEDWYYDPKDFVIKKRVKGIGLLMVQPDQFGVSAKIQDKEIYIKVN